MRSSRRPRRYIGSLEGAVKRASELMACVNRELRISYINPALEQRLGISAQNLIGRTIASVRIFGDWVAEWEQTFLQVLKEGQEKIMELIYDGPEGTEYYEVHSIPQFGVDGQVDSVLSIAHNIDERKQMESILDYRLGFEGIIADLSINFLKHSVFSLDDTIHQALQTVGRYISADRGYVFLFSEQEEKLINTHAWLDEGVKCEVRGNGEFLINPFTWWMEKFLRFEPVCIYKLEDLPPEASYEQQELKRQSIQSLVALPLFYNNALIGFLGFDSIRSRKKWADEDIHLLKILGETLASAIERRNAEKAIHQSEEKFRKLVENAHDLIYSVNRDGTLSYFSPRCAHVLGWSFSEQDGTALLDSIHPEDKEKWLELSKRLYETGEQGRLEYRLRYRDGSWRWHIMSASPLRDDHGHITSCIAISHDTTESRQEKEALAREKELFQVIFQSIGDAIITTDTRGNILLLNKVAEELTGWSQQEAYGKPLELVYRTVNEETGEDHKNPVEKVFSTGKSVGFKNHILLISRDGMERSISDSAAAIRNEDGDLFGAALVFRDVTEEKERKKRIHYLGYHDVSTGLYNRAYFDEMMHKMNNDESCLPLSIILADTNGLKLTNDGFGHQEGDRLLQRIAHILKAECRREDIVARIGGDEFAVILPNTSSQEKFKVIERIKERCEREEADPIKPSLSMGAATKGDMSEDFDSVFQRAENRMYQNKLLESRSIRSSIIASLRRTMAERTYETEEHCQRIKEFSMKIGKGLGLTSNEMDELELVSILHDIGKIGIPDDILSKPGSGLTEKETNIKKNHCEIGYRIAIASQELAPIADCILCHHEWWDGSGYPQGLKSQDIPLLSRIISVADAFDAMTHKETHTNPRSPQAALRELEKNAGTQFDPELVRIFVKMIEKDKVSAALR